jgi:hypothetical protein
VVRYRVDPPTGSEPALVFSVRRFCSRHYLEV